MLGTDIANGDRRDAGPGSGAVANLNLQPTLARQLKNALTDAGSKLGFPPQLLIQPVLEYLDVPKRNEIIQAYQQLMQEQAQAQQAERDLKLRIEEN